MADKDGKVEKPELLAKFTDNTQENDLILITISARIMELDGKERIGIGVGSNEDIEKAIKNSDSFRYAIRESFLRWLDDITGVC